MRDQTQLSSPGRYLSPEPMLQSPEYVRTMAARGKPVPTYAYAANNPLRYVDRNGLDPGDVFSFQRSAALDYYQWQSRQWHAPMLPPTNESCTTIVRMPGGYAYLPPNSGSGDSCKPPSAPARVANCHNHPNPMVKYDVDLNEAYSKGDDAYFDDHAEPQYLQTPSGRILERSAPGTVPAAYPGWGW